MEKEQVKEQVKLEDLLIAVGEITSSLSRIERKAGGAHE